MSRSHLKMVWLPSVVQPETIKDRDLTFNFQVLDFNAAKTLLGIAARSLIVVDR